MIEPYNLDSSFRIQSFMYTSHLYLYGEVQFLIAVYCISLAMLMQQTLFCIMLMNCMNRRMNIISAFF
jgi:hypothetical protein